MNNSLQGCECVLVKGDLPSKNPFLRGIATSTCLGIVDSPNPVGVPALAPVPCAVLFIPLYPPEMRATRTGSAYNPRSRSNLLCPI